MQRRADSSTRSRAFSHTGGFSSTWPTHRLQRLRHVGEIDFGVLDAGGRQLAEVLHQQKINLVANDVGVRGLGQEMLQQLDQPFLRDQRIGLQELAKLVHLNQAVHLIEPLVRLFDGLFAGSVDAGLKIGAGLDVDGELARQFEVDGIEPAGQIPLGCEILHGCGRSHDFTIQLGTSPRKRAATSVLPG